MPAFYCCSGGVRSTRARSGVLWTA